MCSFLHIICSNGTFSLFFRLLRFLLRFNSLEVIHHSFSLAVIYKISLLHGAWGRSCSSLLTVVPPDPSRLNLVLPQNKQRPSSQFLVNTSYYLTIFIIKTFQFLTFLTKLSLNFTVTVAYYIFFLLHMSFSFLLSYIYRTSLSMFYLHIF